MNMHLIGSAPPDCVLQSMHSRDVRTAATSEPFKQRFQRRD